MFSQASVCSTLGGGSALGGKGSALGGRLGREGVCLGREEGSALGGRGSALGGGPPFWGGWGVLPGSLYI